MADSCQWIFFQVLIIQFFCETPSSPAVKSSQPHLLAGQNPAEGHALYLDKLPACRNPAHPVNPVVGDQPNECQSWFS
jgi:hypothetical protein